MQEGRTEKKEGVGGGKEKEMENIHSCLLIILTLSIFFTLPFIDNFRLLYLITTLTPPPPNKGRKTRSYLILNFLYFFSILFFLFFSAVFLVKPPF